MRDYPLTLYTLSFPPCPPHKHIRVCGDPGRGNDKEVRAYRPQTYCTGLPQSYANVFNVDRTPHRNKKTPAGRFLFLGRMTGHLRWTILVQLRIVRDCALTTR